MYQFYFLLDPASVLTRRVPYQLIYQAYSDQLINLIYVVRSALDKSLFAYYSSTNTTNFYEINVELFEFNPSQNKWIANVYIDFFEYLQLNGETYNKILAVINNQDILRASTFSEYSEIGLVKKLAPRVPIGHWCYSHADCMDPNAECGSVCNQNNGAKIITIAARVCKCKANTFQGINLNDNSMMCCKL